MLRIRTVRTSSMATAVQVVEYLRRRTVVLSHIGSARSDKDILLLKQKAADWIVDYGVQMSLFGHMEIAVKDKIKKGKSNKKLLVDEKDDKLLLINNSGRCDTIDWNNFCSSGFRYRLLYETLSDILESGFAFNQFKPNKIKIFLDMVIARIISPGSKLHSLQFLEDYFGIKHQYRSLFRVLDSFNDLKDDIEAKVINVAKQHFKFNFSLVFYDLTTLYFESFETDELRKIGFSKDNKSSQPQIMVGLLVNDNGFPISYQIFPGNKFEGHTLTPSILHLKKKYNIKQMTIVADSAMISEDNILFLKTEQLNYIVGARVASLAIKTIQEISQQLNQIDETTIRIPSQNKGDLICHFSKKRYDKEKKEMDKQLEKAELYLKQPSKAEIIKRTKFLKNKKPGYELNQELIDKTKLLLGIKGYYSNCNNLNNLEIIKHYKNLWHVEKAFRISKSDLKTRPIFHFKEQNIKSHILICFLALALSKYIEIKTNRSIKTVINSLKSATDNIIVNKTTREKIVLKPEINQIIQGLLSEIKMSH